MTAVAVARVDEAAVPITSFGVAAGSVTFSSILQHGINYDSLCSNSVESSSNLTQAVTGEWFPYATL